jgi:hypothetical protein
VIAAEGREPEGQFGEVSRAHDQPVLLVREIHEDLRAFPGLRVLVGDAPVAARQADVLEMAFAGRLDVDLPEADAGSIGEPKRQ